MLYDFSIILFFLLIMFGSFFLVGSLVLLIVSQGRKKREKIKTIKHIANKFWLEK